MDSCISVSFLAPKYWATAMLTPAPMEVQMAVRSQGHGAGQSDGSKGGRADEVSDDHAVSEDCTNLQQVSP